MPNRTQELLESLMVGHAMTPGELDAVLGDNVKEDLHLEYKHGNLLADSSARRTLREYVSGFANSAGGVLIIGVDENMWSVTGCRAPGGHDLKEWATECLTPLAPYISPPERSYVIPHSSGDVLVIATARSFSLVPCNEGGELVYYFRHGHQTLRAEPYLISDLVLGRRQHPQLGMTARVTLRHRRESYVVTGNVTLTLENEGFSELEITQFGAIYWKLGKHEERFSKHLLDYLVVSKPTHTHPMGSYLGVTNLGGMLIRLYAFAERSLSVDFPPWEPGLLVRIAIFVVVRDAPPIWYQLDFEMHPQPLKLTFEDISVDARLERTWSDRPIVALITLSE